MRKKRLLLTIEGKPHEILVQNVYAKGNEEFLDGIDPASQVALHVRLDKIEKVFDPSEKNPTFLPSVHGSSISFIQKKSLCENPLLII